MVMLGLLLITGGFPVNYFAKLKYLKPNDTIIYTTPYGTRTYGVVLSIDINDTDWSYLQDYNDNRLTLITCIENNPSQRKCIQAVEIT